MVREKDFMLVGYVSDEDYVALCGVDFEFKNENCAVSAQSYVTGAIYAEIEPGHYSVSLGKPGYGSNELRSKPLRKDLTSFACCQIVCVVSCGPSGFVRGRPRSTVFIR